MAHRDNRSYYRDIQRYYRPKYFKAFRRAVWVILLILALCIWAAITT